MAVLKWQDPPSKQTGTSGNYDADIEELKRNPGRWALIKEDWKTSSPPGAFRQNRCEVTTRRNKDGKTWKVYARFPLARQRAAEAPPIPVNAEQAKVREAIKSGTALTPPPAAPKRQAPPAAAVAPANDFGMDAWKAARAARGVPPEGKR